MALLLFLLGMLGYMTLLAVVSGITVSILWGWFVAPVFNLPDLTLLQAMGLTLIISYFVARVDTKPKESDKISKLMAMLLTPFARAGVILLIGLVYKLLM